MKRIIYVLVVCMVKLSFLHAEDAGLLVGKKAPEFTGKAVIENTIFPDFSLQDLRGRYVLLFFYPLDFTFVCPTELHAFQDRLEEFFDRNIQVVACSVDSCYSHLAWLSIPKSEGGIEGVTYPLVSDMNKSIAKKYHVLDEDAGIAYRGLFIIDPEGIIRYQQVNDLPIGRSVHEVLRLCDALMFHREHGDVCPANWEEGDPGMRADQEGLLDFFQQDDE